MVTRGEVWSHVLLMIRFLFTVSVSNAKLERMFSNLKHIKTNFCCFLGVKRLENILKIMEEVSNWENFDLISAMKKWSIDRIRRATEEKDRLASNHVILLKSMLKLSVMMTVKMRRKTFLAMVTQNVFV